MHVPVQNIRVWLSRNENRHFISQIALLGSVSIFCIYDSFSCFVCFFCCLSSSFTVSVEFSRVYASKFSYGSVPCFLAAVHFLVSCVSLSCPLWMFLSHVRVSLRVSSPVPMSLPMSPPSFPCFHVRSSQPIMSLALCVSLSLPVSLTPRPSRVVISSPVSVSSPVPVSSHESGHSLFLLFLTAPRPVFSMFSFASFCVIMSIHPSCVHRVFPLPSSPCCV